MRKLTKKLLAVTLTTATLLSGFAIAPTQKADAKAKNYNAYLMFANKKFSCVNMNEKVASTKIANKKGSKKYTLTLKRNKCVNNNKKTEKATVATEAQVFCVDIKDILKDHNVKNVKISNVVIKCDGKKVKFKMAKTAQGQLEKTSDEWGEGGTKSHPCAKPAAFKWKKNISVSFKLTIKK